MLLVFGLYEKVFKKIHFKLESNMLLMSFHESEKVCVPFSLDGYLNVHVIFESN